MACHRYISPDGQVAAIVCGPRQRLRRCSVCGKNAGLLCDFPDASRRSRTCDKPLCAVCARKASGGRDYCPSHFEPPAKQPAATELRQPEQLTLKFEGKTR